MCFFSSRKQYLFACACFGARAFFNICAYVCVCVLIWWHFWNNSSSEKKSRCHLHRNSVSIKHMGDYSFANCLLNYSFVERNYEEKDEMHASCAHDLMRTRNHLSRRVYVCVCESHAQSLNSPMKFDTNSNRTIIFGFLLLNSDARTPIASHANFANFNRIRWKRRRRDASGKRWTRGEWN